MSSLILAFALVLSGRASAQPTGLDHWVSPAKPAGSSCAAHIRRRSSAISSTTFALNPDGSIDLARMRAVSPDTDFTVDFQDLVRVAL